MKYDCSNCNKSFSSKRGLSIHSRSCKKTERKTTPITTKKQTKNKKKSLLVTVLISFILFILFANLGVMIYFTSTVNTKLVEAIEFSKPQVGNFILINPDNCSQCRDLVALKNTLQAQNIDIKNDKIINSSSADAQTLIIKNSIQKLPALIFESEEYIKPQLKNAIKKGGNEINSKTLVWEQSNPPYYNIASDETKGLVSIYFPTDKTCEECYDINIQKQIIENFGITTTTEDIFDISNEKGIELIEKYKITKVPTVILSKQASVYTQFTSIWQQAGSVENDGSFVFRNMDAIQAKYRNLENGEIEG